MRVARQKSLKTQDFGRPCDRLEEAGDGREPGGDAAGVASEVLILSEVRASL